MTRINVVPPEELCDQHLLAEWRELTRIPNGIVNNKFKLDTPIPKTYRLGEGHVRFFLDKLGYLCERYIIILQECNKRGFRVTNNWPTEKLLNPLNHNIWQYWVPDKKSLILNRKRIFERMPNKPRYYGN